VFTYGADRHPVLFTCPPMRVVHEPSIWDDAKQAKWGKSGKPLDPDRKSDKWSLDLEAEEEFIAFINALIRRFAELIYENQAKLSLGKLLSKEVIESKFDAFPVIKKDTKTGVRTLSFDGRVEKGSTEMPIVLVDKNGEKIKDAPHIGRDSILQPIPRMSSVRIGAGFKDAKTYVDPYEFIPVQCIAPAEDMKNTRVKPDLGDD
jgi:hypothetical protein